MSNHPNDRETPSSEPNDRAAFLRTFQKAAARHGLTIVSQQGDSALCRDRHGEPCSLRLQNLFRSCSRHDPADWPALMDNFLQNARSPDEQEMPEDLHSVADQLLPRLGPPVTHQDARTRIWWKKLDPERVWLNLVIDYPTRMLYVSRELVDGSGESGEYWLDRALDNLRDRSGPDTAGIINEEIGLHLIATEDSYDATRALILDTLLPQTQEFGCFVAPIGRDELLVLPVDIEALPHVHILKLLARDHYPTAPYAISDEVFWIWRGKWRLFPIQVKGDSITVSPPDEFVEVLNRLAREDEAGEEG